MDILASLLNSARGGAVEKAAGQLGLKTQDSEALLRQLVPALATGLQRNVADRDGLAKLAAALGAGNHQRYLDDPQALEKSAAVEDGNAILGHLFGSKDVSRQVAAEAAGTTGIDAATIKRFLPIVAAAAMGALSKQTDGGSRLSDAGGALGLLGQLLGGAGSGSTVGKLLSIGKRFF
jgi:hypothetical protein